MLDLDATITRVQRWRERSESWRSNPDERIDPGLFGVEPIDSDRVARDFIVRHHYAATYPAARYRVGLYRSRGPFQSRELCGVAVFGVPCNQHVVPKWLGGLEPHEGVELSRFVLLDDVERNGETWFLSRAFEALSQAKPQIRGVVSYADPLPRRGLSGESITPGHIGIIYQGHNGSYAGRARKKTLWLTQDGRCLDGRLLSKVRAGPGEQGHDYAAAALLAAGAPTRSFGEPWARWTRRALSEGPFRRIRHPGNHVYCWPVGEGRKARKQLRRRLVQDHYPRFADAA